MQSNQKNTKTSGDSQRKSTQSERTNEGSRLESSSTEPPKGRRAQDDGTSTHENAGDHRDYAESNLILKAAVKSLTYKIENSAKAKQNTTIVSGHGNGPYSNLLNGGDSSAIGKLTIDQEMKEKDDLKIPNPFCDRFVLADSASPITKTAIKRDQNTLLELPAEVVGLIQESFHKTMEAKVPDQAAFYVQPEKDGYYFGSDEKKSLEGTAVDTSEETLESLEYESSDGQSSSPDYETAYAMTPDDSERDVLPDFGSKLNIPVETIDTNIPQTIDSLPFDEEPRKQSTNSNTPGTPTASQDIVPTEEICPPSGKLSCEASSKVFPEVMIEVRPKTGKKEISSELLAKKKPSTAGFPSDDSSLGSYPYANEHEKLVYTPRLRHKPDSPPEGDAREQFCDHLDKCTKKHWTHDGAAQEVPKKPPIHPKQPKTSTVKGAIPSDLFPNSRRGKSLFSAVTPKSKEESSNTDSGGEDKRHPYGPKYTHMEKRVLIRTKVQARSVAPMSTIVDSPRYHPSGNDKPHWRF